MSNEWIWFAGLFEGEGCINICRQKGRRTSRISLVIRMTDEDVMLRVSQLLNRKLYKCKKQQPHHKQAWQCNIQNREDILRVLSYIEPYMGERRRQSIEEVREYYRWWDETKHT